MNGNLILTMESVKRISERPLCILDTKGSFCFLYGSHREMRAFFCDGSTGFLFVKTCQKSGGAAIDPAK